MRALIHSDMPVFAYTLLNISMSASTLQVSLSIVVTFLLGIKTYDEIKRRVEQRHGGSWKAYAKSLTKTKKPKPKKPNV